MHKCVTLTKAYYVAVISKFDDKPVTCGGDVSSSTVYMLQAQIQVVLLYQRSSNLTVGHSKPGATYN